MCVYCPVKKEKVAHNFVVHTDVRTLLSLEASLKGKEQQQSSVQNHSKDGKGQVHPENGEISEVTLCLTEYANSYTNIHVW